MFVNQAPLSRVMLGFGSVWTSSHDSLCFRQHWSYCQHICAGRWDGEKRYCVLAVTLPVLIAHLPHSAGWKMEWGAEFLHCSILPSQTLEGTDDFIADLREAVQTRHIQSQVNLHMTDTNFYCEYFHSFTCVWLNCTYMYGFVFIHTAKINWQGLSLQCDHATILLLVLQLFLGCQASWRLQKD